MTENARLTVSIDRIELEFVEREATPRLLMKLILMDIASVFTYGNSATRSNHDEHQILFGLRDVQLKGLVNRQTAI